jgi:hypothetical protein
VAGYQNLTGVASLDLGLGSNLSQQVKDDTEEEKRKRRLGMSALQSPAASMLLGTGMGMGNVGKI